jgi:hypothetical protein
MAVPMLREQDVDRLLGAGCLSVVGNYPWRQRSKKSWYKIEIDVMVQAPSPPNLRIVVSLSCLDNSKYTFVLLWNNVRVRALCVNGSHRNNHANTESWVCRTHKHRWTDNCHDRLAYTPTDITASDLQGQFVQFCQECGIRSEAFLAAIPSQQRGFFDDL